MPRHPRFDLPGVPQHVIQRGVDRQPAFFSDDDCRFYLDWLAEYASKRDIALHAYCLMTNHVQRYVELNPVRAAMVPVPGEYRVPFLDSACQLS